MATAVLLDSNSRSRIHRLLCISGTSAVASLVKNRLGLLRNAFSVARRWSIYAEFLSPAYQSHNIARLQHLDSLGLDLSGKRVLEVGAGVGDHTLFYLYRGCEVLPTDGRPALVRFIRQRFGIRAEILDAVEDVSKLARIGEFDILHCYGLLYHLSNPEEFLAATAKVTSCLLLETCVSYGSETSPNIVREDASIPSQAFHGQGCRPTRSWVFNTLKCHYEFVYTTTTQPRHCEFPQDWREAPERPGLSRAVFVASHSPIQSRRLSTSLPMVHDVW